MIIYKTTNLVNGKFYIGKDVRNDPNYLGSGILLSKAIKKYGADNFRKEIIEECKNQIELAEREIYWIDKLNANDRSIAYNIAPGGLGGDTFAHNPNKEEIRERHREATSKLMKERNGYFEDTNKQRKACIKGGKSHLGKKRSKDTCQKISESLKGRVITDEWKENISKGTKEAMAKLDQKELQRKALEGRKKAWKKRDEERKEKLKQILELGLKSTENIKLLGVSVPTYYKILRLIKTEENKGQK